MPSILRVLILSVATTAIAGCIPVPLPPTEERVLPACVATRFPDNPAIGAATVDKFTGRYTTATQTLTVRRDDHRLLVEQHGFGTRELTTDSIESWTWRDGCGVSYQFILPPDGPGAMLDITDADGSKSHWKRAS